MRNLILIVSIITVFLAACATQPIAQTPVIGQQENVSSQEEHTVNVTPVIPPQPKEEIIPLNGSTNTLFNNKQQKFQWTAEGKTYVIELRYVSADGELCQIKINGKTGIYEKGKETLFDDGLSVLVMEAVATHGFTGDACKVGLYNPK